MTKFSEQFVRGRDSKSGGEYRVDVERAIYRSSQVRFLGPKDRTMGHTFGRG